MGGKKSDTKHIPIRKLLVLISLFIIIVLFPITLYLYLSRSSTGVAWYSNDWGFRSGIEVSNDTLGVLTNEDVLVELDTAALVTANKLQVDCDDLRFVDGDDNSLLSFWVEGGCNTASTNIWVRIPSLPAGGKTIYMYYGNPIAGGGSQTWSGEFTFLSDTACPVGWTRNSDMDSRFIYGSSSYGTTGGSNSSHNHLGSVTVTTGGPSATVPPRNPGTGALLAASSSHTHQVTIPIGSSSGIPPYLTMIFCKQSELILPAGFIALFDSASLPTGWTRFAALDNKFPYGGSSYGTTGGATNHTHGVTAATTGPEIGARFYYNAGFSNYYPVRLNKDPHTHQATPSCSTGSNIPPNLSMVFAKSSASANLNGMIALSSAVPPLGWSRFEDLDSKFPLGSQTPGTSGGAATHTHVISVATGAASSSTSSDGGSQAVSKGDHSHYGGSSTTSSQSNLPAYISVIYVQRKTSQTATPGTEEANNTVPNAPSSLLTEGQTNPSRVTDSTPEFSAIFSDTDTSDTGDNYQIQVNTASDFTGTSMWDSTKTALSPVVTNGSRSQDISYAGSTLSEGTTYYWRMKFWDNVDAESDWSSTANFTMNTTPTAPTALLTEGLTNPNGIADTTPEFSAIFNDPDTGDTGVSYQIEVNTASDFTGTSMWDSSLTEMTATAIGATSPNISYAGTTLTR